MSTIKTTMTADAQQLINEQKRVGQGAAEVNNEYREASRELAQLGRVSSQVFREMSTPLDKYNKQMEALNKDLERGKITQSQYNEAVDHVREKYDSATRSGSAFSGVLSEVVGMATGMLTLGTVVQTVSQYFSDAKEEARGFAENIRVAIDSRNELAQVTDLQTADSQIAQFMKFGGMGSNRNLAASAVFELQSAGMTDDIKTFLDLGRSGLIKPADIPGMISSLDTLQSAFTPAETGSSRSILAKAIVAGAVAKGTTADVVNATGGIGASAAALGLSDEESMAAISVVSKTLGAKGAQSPLENLFKVLSRLDMNGSLIDSLNKIEAQKSSGKKLADIFGSTDMMAEQATNLLLTNKQAVIDMTAQLQAANGGEALDAKQALLFNDPKTRVNIRQNEIEAAKEILNEPLGLRQANKDSLLEARYELNKLRMSPAMAWINSAVENWLFSFDSLAGNQAMAKRDLAIAESQGEEGAVILLKRIVEIQQEMLDESKKQKDRPQRPTVPKPERGG